MVKTFAPVRDSQKWIHVAWSSNQTFERIWRIVDKSIAGRIKNSSTVVNTEAKNIGLKLNSNISMLKHDIDSNSTMDRSMKMQAWSSQFKTDAKTPTINLSGHES
jgi:hypothetical protein